MKYSFPTFPLFLSVLVLVSAIALFILVNREVESLNGQATDTWLKWSTERDRRDNLLSIEAAIARTVEDRNKLTSHFATSSNAVPFLDMIEQSGRKVGAVTEVASVDLPKDNSGLIVRVESTGSFEAIYKFIKLLESSPYQLEFNSFNIRNSGGGGGQWSAAMEMRLLTFIK